MSHDVARWPRPLRLLRDPRADTGSLVLTREEARTLGQIILRFASTETGQVELTHTAQRVTRVTNNHPLTGDDGDELQLRVTTTLGLKGTVTLQTNDVDETALRAAVTRAEAMARLLPGSSVNLLAQPTGPQEYLPVHLWHEETVMAMRERPSVLSAMIEVAQSRNLSASGFVGLMARSAMRLNRSGLESYYRETDCECTMTARTADGTGSGWHGEAHRNWTQIDPIRIATTAADIATRAAHPRALEPGRRTAIFSPTAVVQLVHLMRYAFDAHLTDHGGTPFSKFPTGNKIGEQVFSSQVTISSDPADPEGGYRPDFAEGLPEPTMQWVKQGVLTNLAYDPYYAVAQGKAYAGSPWSWRMSGGAMTEEQMIQSCAEGLYVNRVSNVQLLDGATGLLSGVTRDGCFLVKHGTIERPVKNFRFIESPWFFLNRILGMGPPTRAAFGYTPPVGEGNQIETRWPRRPIIVPPLIVQDFNFNRLAEAI